MPQLPLFDAMDDRPPQAARLAPRLQALAREGLYFGTSSWKYEGWVGSIYASERYTTRGKFSRKKFEAECLAEYAEVFPTVCGDFAFYQFPTPEYWEKLFRETPRSFRFAFKVPEDITVARWPKHARYGTRAGKDNENFLNGDAYIKLFTRRLEPYRDQVGPLILEFGTFPKSTFATRDDFLNALAPFLEQLPGNFQHAIEIRNPDYLSETYFSFLASYNVAHVFNAWTRMPELEEQAAMPGAFTADFSVVRALLTRGVSYEAAVSSLEPYQAVKTPNPRAREGLSLIAGQARMRRKPAFLFVNNRLEGNSPTTIESVVATL